VWAVHVQPHGKQTSADTAFDLLVAPKLDWLVIQRKTSRGGKTVGWVSAIKIVQGDPPGNLFSVPANGRLMSFKDFVVNADR
jgi:hypothetical protein